MSAQCAGMKTGRHGRVWCPGSRLLSWCFWPAAGRAQTPQAESKPVKLVSIKPTVLFTGERAGASPAHGRGHRESGCGGAGESGCADRIVQSVCIDRDACGRANRRSTCPCRTSASRCRRSSCSRWTGQALDTRQMDWRPRKHWTIYFVPITHHDLGYTDTIENVLNRYAGFYDDVLRFCDQTNDWPEEAKYRYTLEGTLVAAALHREPAEGGRGQARRLRQAGPDRDRGPVRQRDRQPLRARGAGPPDVPVVSLQASVRRRDHRRLDHRPARPELGPADGAGGGGGEVLLRRAADVLRVGPQRHSHVLGRGGDPASRPARRLPLAGAGRADRARLLPGQLRVLQTRDRAGHV